MKIIEFRSVGEPVDVLAAGEQPEPALSGGQVKVKLTARAIHPSDLMNVRGQYGKPPPLPFVPGNDAAGVVEAVGDGVQGFAPGDRVILMLGATAGTGTWKEKVVVPAAMLVKTPKALSDEQAGSVWVNYLSAWVLMLELGLQPGDTLLQTAAGSQLGRAMIELARLKGFSLVNVVRRREQVGELHQLGAETVLCTADAPLHEQVKTLTKGKGVKFAIDSVGGPTAAGVIESLSVGGTAVLFGVLDTANAAVTFNPGLMLFKELHVRGFWLTRWLATAGGKHRQMVDEMLPLFENGTFKPAIDSSFSFDRFRDAVLRAETAGRSGAVVLTS